MGDDLVEKWMEGYGKRKEEEKRRSLEMKKSQV